jgi:hypothetical protein
MAGKLTIGTTETIRDPILARAYCAGRLASISGGLPNTHVKGTPEWSAYDNGVMSRMMYAAGTVDNCANPVPNTVAVPSLIGLTSSAANVKLLQYGFIAGTVTGTTGVVTVQSPVADVAATYGSAINYTIA